MKVLYETIVVLVSVCLLIASVVESRGSGNLGGVWNRANKLSGKLRGGMSIKDAREFFGHPLAFNPVNVLGVVNPSFRPLGYKAAKAMYRNSVGLP